MRSSTAPCSTLDADTSRRERRLIKWICCIIRPEGVQAVTEALIEREIGGMTVTDVRGFGRQKGQTEHYRGGEYTIRFLPKVRIDIAVPAEDVELVFAAIMAAARTGQVGDGKVFVSSIKGALRIRTGEQGLEAL